MYGGTERYFPLRKTNFSYIKYLTIKVLRKFWTESKNSRLENMLVSYEPQSNINETSELFSVFKTLNSALLSQAYM